MAWLWVNVTLSLLPVSFVGLFLTFNAVIFVISFLFFVLVIYIRENSLFGWSYVYSFQHHAHAHAHAYIVYVVSSSIIEPRNWPLWCKSKQTTIIFTSLLIWQCNLTSKFICTIWISLIKYRRQKQKEDWWENAIMYLFVSWLLFGSIRREKRWRSQSTQKV